jgi:hypothetical protein
MLAHLFITKIVIPLIAAESQQTMYYLKLSCVGLDAPVRACACVCVCWRSDCIGLITPQAALAVNTNWLHKFPGLGHLSYCLSFTTVHALSHLYCLFIYYLPST